MRHTDIAAVFIPPSLSGSGQWPEIPSEFAQIEARLRELNAHPPVPGGDGFWMVWDTEQDKYVESDFPLPEGGAMMIGGGLRYDNGRLVVDTADKVERDNTRPVTSAAVHMELGNIEALLAAL